MAMNYKEVPKGLPKEEAVKYATGIGLVNSFVESLMEKRLLPKEFSQSEVSDALKTPKSSFEIPTVSEALYNKTREALAKEGYTFVVNISPISIGQLAMNKETSQRFGYINPSSEMRSNVPPQMEVAIDPNNFKIDNSNNLSTDRQIGETRKQESILKVKLPEDVRSVISMLKPPNHASILAQLDFEHQKRTGKVLFTNWFGRTDDQTVPGNVARVGRGDPAGRLDVDGWDRDDSGDRVFAVPVVVLPRKLAI